MAARYEDFPWPSHYGHFKFFEQRMKDHRCTSELETEGKGLYKLTRKDGKVIRIFICECYAYGVAQYMETIKNIGQIDAVIINSAWCGYSPDAKNHCREQRVGLFTIGEFMSALHHDDYWNYLTEFEAEYFKKQGWL